MPLTITTQTCDRISDYADKLEKWADQIEIHGKPINHIQHLEYDVETGTVFAGRFSERRDIIWIDVTDSFGSRRLWVGHSSHNPYSVTAEWREQEDGDENERNNDLRIVHRHIARECIQDNLDLWVRHMAFYNEEMWMAAVGYAPAIGADRLRRVMSAIKAGA